LTFICGQKKRELYAVGTGAMKQYDDPKSDYFAATILSSSSPQPYYFDCIPVSLFSPCPSRSLFDSPAKGIQAIGSAKLSFVSPQDSLTVNSTSVLNGTGTVYVAGHLDASDDLWPGTTQLSFALLPGSTGNFPSSIVVSNNKIFVFGTIMQGMLYIFFFLSFEFVSLRYCKCRLLLTLLTTETGR
jgi:hypothetical protein